MQIGVPREILAGETRVAASPKSVEQLIKLGFDVAIENNAGSLASFDDEAYKNVGAVIVSKEEIWGGDEGSYKGKVRRVGMQGGGEDRGKKKGCRGRTKKMERKDGRKMRKGNKGRKCTEKVGRETVR